MADQTKEQKAQVDQEIASRVGTFDSTQASELGRQTSAANSASQAAIDAIDAKNRELSAVIARYGQQGRQNLERYSQRNAEDMAAAQQQFAVGQGSRQIGTMSDAERNVHTGGLTRQYQRHGEDMTAIGNMQIDAWGQYGGLMSNYMQQAAAASPLIAQQTIADLQARQAAARAGFVDDLNTWGLDQYRSIDEAARAAQEAAAEEERKAREEAEKAAANVSHSDMRVQALAEGRRARDGEISALEMMLRQYEDAGATQLALSAQRRLQQLRARPESAWATDAAVKMFGDIGRGLFDEDGPTAEQQRRAAYDAAGYAVTEDAVRQYAATQSPAGQAVAALDSVSAKLPAWMRPQRPYSSRLPASSNIPDQVPAGVLRTAADQRALSPFAVEYLVQNGMAESDAIELVYGTRSVDQYGQRPQSAGASEEQALLENPDYQTARDWLLSAAQSGISQDDARAQLLAAGYDPFIVTELLKRVDLGYGF